MNTDDVRLEKNHRNLLLDIEKGIAISLVVLGHVVCKVWDDVYFRDNIVFKVCYSFHMPLFIYICGYIATLSGNRGGILFSDKWLKKRTLSLMVPYTIWTFIKWAIYKENSLVNSFFVFPLYWFLVNLWIYHLITWFSSKFKRRKFIEFLCYFLLICLQIINGDNNMIIKNAVMYMPFYLIGRIISDKRWDNKDIFNRIKNISIIIYPLSMVLYTYENNGKWVPVVNELTHNILPETLIKLILTFYNHYFVATFGILFVQFFSEKIVLNLKKARVVFSYLGKVTLPIYLLHGFFFIYIKNNILAAVISFLISITISVLIYELVSLEPRYACLLFGTSGNLINSKCGVQKK